MCHNTVLSASHCFEQPALKGVCKQRDIRAPFIAQSFSLSRTSAKSNSKYFSLCTYMGVKLGWNREKRGRRSRDTLPLVIVNIKKSSYSIQYTAAE